jgi:hypothetical protein
MKKRNKLEIDQADMISYQTIEKFIRYVFDYYNGRINIFNPARLIIEWAAKYKYNTKDAGYSRLPNVVIINPNVVIRAAQDLPNFKYILIETIIHELYHTDQIISYTMLDMYGNDDASYRAAMESATEIQTLLYIANNLPEIQNKFKIKVDMSDDYVNSNLAVYEQFRFPYHRRRFEDHLFMLIDACVRDSKENRIKILNTIRYCICYKKSITVTINGDTLPVQIAPASPTEKPYIAPISTVNDFFYDHIFKYDHNVGVNTLISRDAESGNLTVNIDIDKSYYDIVLY